jgi:hypothetical protein
MTPDPYTNSAGPTDPGSWNRYAYTRGDPVNRIDPNGTCDEYLDDSPFDSDCGAAMAAASFFLSACDPSCQEAITFGGIIQAQLNGQDCSQVTYSGFQGLPSVALPGCGAAIPVAYNYESVPTLIGIVPGSDCYSVTYSPPGLGAARLAEREISYEVFDQMGDVMPNVQIREILTPINGAVCPSGTTKQNGLCYGQWVTGTFNDVQQIQPGVSVQSYYQSFEVRAPGGFDQIVPISAYNSSPQRQIRIDKRPWRIYINGNNGYNQSGTAPLKRCP